MIRILLSPKWVCRFLLLIGFSGMFLFLSPGGIDIEASPWSWFEFTLPWDDGSSSFLSYPSSGSVTQPIRVGTDGHFHLGTASGPRIRFFGVNFTGSGGFLSHDQADRTAKRLAKLGFNFAKFTLIDSILVMSTSPLTLNETALDQLFYFIAKLKENGIYVGIQLNIMGDNNRPTVYFDPWVIQLQKDYARELLTERVNSYTGLTLAQDPALGLVQFTNEIYMLPGFQTCKLHTEAECGVTGAGIIPFRQIAPPPPEWRFGGPMVPENVNQAESDELDVMWNQRLLTHYGSRDALQTAWSCSGKIGLEAGEDPAAGTVERILYNDWDLYCPNRLMDTVTFYYQLAQDHIDDMYSYLKDTLGLNIPITTVENFAGMPTKFAQHGTNTMAQHIPWAHPWFFNGDIFMNPPFQYVNAPEVKGPYTGAKRPDWPWWIEFRNTIWKAVVTSAVEDRPFILGEYNHPGPNEFQAEFPLLISAYANYQDWDGILLHEYAAAPSQIGNGMIDQGFELADNPAVMAQIPAAARVFRNGWVQAGSEGNELDVPFWEDGAFNGNSGVLNDWWDCLSPHYCYWENTSIPNPKGITPAWSLERKTRMEFLSSSTSVPSPGTPSPPYDSDTGELHWDTTTGLVTVDAPRVQAAIGFVGSQQVNLSSLRVNATTDFAAIGLVPLDGATIDTSQKLLLTAVSRVMNTGQNPAPPQPQQELTFNSWGGPPVLLEPVEAQVTLTLPQAGLIRVYRLDETGNLGTQVAYQVGSEITFSIGGQGTLWYGIVVEPTNTAAVFRVTREGDVLADRAFYCGLASGCFNAGQGADIAEHINVSEPVEPGDVVELDPQHPGYYRKARSPYSRLVAGVISTQPGVTMGQLSGNPKAVSPSIPQTALSNLNLAFALSAEHHSPVSLGNLLADNLLPGPLTFDISLSQLLNYSYLPPSTGAEGKPLLALMGVVPVKATMENGPIHPGDLLVPASTPGYVMRCDDLHKCEGAIVGKALEPLDKGKGEGIIQMLVMR